MWKHVENLASFPGSPPPLCFIRAILFTRNYCQREGPREGESLGGFDHVRTLMTRSVSIVSTYESPKERERSPDQHAGRLFGVLYRWLDRWTRLPANVLTPRALKSQTVPVSWLPWSNDDRSQRFKSARCQNIGWQSCPSIEPSIEHSKKPTSMLIRASFSFFWTLIRGHNGHWTRHQCPHVIKASQALPLPRPFSLTIISHK